MALDWYNDAFILSNPNPIKPDHYKPEPEYIKHMGWQSGYSFRHFWGNVSAIIGDDSLGMQRLAHHYYLQNGEISALDTVQRIRKFIDEPIR
jgi:hypothetical protein